MYAQKEKPKENKSKAVANSVAQKKSNKEQGLVFVDNRKNNITQLKSNNHNNRGDQVGQLKANQSLQEIRALPLIQLMKKWENGNLTEIDNKPEDIKQYQEYRIGGEVNDTVYVHQKSLADFPYWDNIEDSDTEEAGYGAESENEQEYELLTVKHIYPPESDYHKLPALEGPSNNWDESHFEGMGMEKPLTSVTLQRPKQGGTHYEVMCLVDGVHVKLHLTTGGYQLIYGADPNYQADYFRDAEPESVDGKTGADLYREFLHIAQQNGKFNMETNDCERFANNLVNAIKGEVEDDFM